MSNLRLPDISGTDKEQLAKIRSYLYQLIPQLNFALNSMGESKAEQPIATSRLPDNTINDANAQATATFNDIKALIIKSADIVNAYYDVINERLDGVYVAESDFGTFAEQTSQQIQANSTETTQRFENIQIIITEQGSEISSVSDEVASVKGNLQTIGEDISYAQRDILAVSADIENLGGNVSEIENNVSVLDEDLQNAKTELSENIGNAKEELTGEINSAKEELTGEINSAKEELTNMVDDVDGDLQETKTATNERIDDTNGSVAGLGVGLQDANSKIADVDEDLQNTKEVINDSIQGVQASLTDANTLLEDAKAQLQGSIDDLEVFITGLQQAIIGVTAYLKSGLLYYTDAGIPVYGLEIGQSVKDEVAGEEVFNKYARFTSEKLSFYDQNGSEVAYISDKKLYIRIAEITVAFKIGGLIDLVMANGDVVTKWVGG